MRSSWRLVRPMLFCGVAACSSSSAAVSDPDLDAGAVPDASLDSTTVGGDGAAGEDMPDGEADASIPIADARPDGGPGDAEVDASKSCVSYCQCMAMNCADKVFPDGCLHDCATQTDWDLPCRANMCGLVPAEPNNDHCTHAFGVNECLDQ